MNISALKAPRPKNEAPMFKKTMQEHLYSDYSLIEAKSTSLDLTESVYIFWDTR